jgi:hypothetical protein
MKVNLEIEQADLNRVMNGTPKQIRYFVHNHKEFAKLQRVIDYNVQEVVNKILQEADKHYEKTKKSIFLFVTLMLGTEPRRMPSLQQFDLGSMNDSHPNASSILR